MKSILLLITILFTMPALAMAYKTNPKIDELFRNANVRGTFIVFDLHASSYVVHNPSRVEKRYVPASTFKIPNSLIGLSVGAVRDVDELLPYGGNPQPIKM